VTPAFLEKKTMTWPRWINIVLGVWLLIAPTALGYVDIYATNNDHLIGLLVAVFAAAALWVPNVRFANVVIGVWLVLAPFVLGYFTSSAVANDIIVGIAVAVVAMIPSRPLPRVGLGPNTPSGPLR
jgi:hypothetical protein